MSLEKRKLSLFVSLVAEPEEGNCRSWSTAADWVRASCATRGRTRQNTLMLPFSSCTSIGLVKYQHFVIFPLRISLSWQPSGQKRISKALHC